MKYEIINIGNETDEKCLQQALNCLNHSRNVDNVILFPDTHTGYGIPIGCMATLKNAISPNMVGADIGCGIRAFKTSLKTSDVSTDQLKQIMSLIRSCIPVGFEWNKSYDKENLPVVIKKINGLDCIDHKFPSIIRTNYEKICLQYGTLGGGNHFIEIQKDDEGWIWVMIHCGSRNIGKLVGEYYNNLIKESGYFPIKDVENDIGALDLHSIAGKSYLRDMNWCLEFAFENRKRISNLIFDCFRQVFPGITRTPDIDIHHNYAQVLDFEDIDTKEKYQVVIHRKGCVDLTTSKGIIAGSQGTSSFIVEYGDKAYRYQYTCSHGSGRVMGRREAIRKLNLEEEKKFLDDQGIIHAIRNQDDLEEAAHCYKDIQKVIKDQVNCGIIKVIKELKPMAVIKG